MSPAAELPPEGIDTRPPGCRGCLDCGGLSGVCTDVACFCHQPERRAITLSRIFSSRLSMPELAKARAAAYADERDVTAWAGVHPSGDPAGIEVIVDGERLGIETAAGAIWREFTLSYDGADDGRIAGIVMELIPGIEVTVRPWR